MLVKSVFLFWLFWSCAYCLEFITNEKQNPALQVKTINGIVQGKEETRNGKVHFSFQGIPYARPPIYNLRFRPPKAARNWLGTLDASKEGSNCIEIVARDGVTVSGSENCLFINVYTPQNPRKPAKSLPVMVWIYGGAFIEGSSKEYYYGPRHFMGQDVIIVTFNYRLGVFGFLSTGDLESPGNYGLKDQNQALKWVQKNIHNFGGDKKRVTLFGQSAGAASVLYHMQSPKSRGLFQKAIAQSGSSLSNFVLQREPKEVALDIAAHLNLDVGSTKEFVDILRRLDANLVARAQIQPAAWNMLRYRKYGLPYAPVIEPPHKTAFFTENSYQLLNNGNFERIPLIIGVNTQESIAIEPLIKQTWDLNVLYDLSPGLLAMPSMNTNSYQNNTIVGNSIHKYYFKAGAMSRGTLEEMFNFVTDDNFVRPVRKTVELMSKYIPLYYYVFSYEGDLGIQNEGGFPKEKRIYNGVAHSEELWYMWDRSDASKIINQNDDLILKRMVKLWTNFAKTSNPTPTKDPLFQNLIWPNVKSIKNVTYLNINSDLRLNNIFKNDQVHFWDSLYYAYGHRPYSTY